MRPGAVSVLTFVDPRTSKILYPCDEGVPIIVHSYSRVKSILTFRADVVVDARWMCPCPISVLTFKDMRVQTIRFSPNDESIPIVIHCDSGFRCVLTMRAKAIPETFGMDPFSFSVLTLVKSQPRTITLLPDNEGIAV